MTGPVISSYQVGHSVVIPGVGPGIINEVLGGPVDYLYRVVLFGLDIDTGLPTSRVVRDDEMTHGDPLPAFEVGDSVRYIGRMGEVVLVYDDRVTFIVPGDPVGEYSGVSEPRRFDVPAWHLFLSQQL